MLRVMSPPLIQCSTGNHFVCESCRNQMKRNCPVCRTSKLFHNQFLEKSLFFTKCDYCPRRLFPWSIESHHQQCIYQPSECFSCKKTLNLSELKHHIRSNECDTEWMESCFDETACTFESLESTLRSASLNRKDQGYRSNWAPCKLNSSIHCKHICVNRR